MATKVTLSSPLPFKTSMLPKSLSLSPALNTLSSPKRNVPGVKIHAKLGGSGDEEIQKGGKKKFITRDEEPQQYWQTAGEREGENPMKTPLPYIIIFGEGVGVALTSFKTVYDVEYYVDQSFTAGESQTGVG